MSNTRFHQLEVGQAFRRDERGPVYVKLNKITAVIEGNKQNPGAYRRINSQALVTPTDALDLEASWEELDPHTFDFTPKQAADVIEKIIERAQAQYGTHRINADRLRKGLNAAHRAKPIRLIDLLNTCNVDFPSEVLYGVYRHYDEETDTLKNGWTAQHSEPHRDFWSFLFGDDDDEEID